MVKSIDSVSLAEVQYCTMIWYISHPQNLKFKEDSDTVHHSCKALIIWLLADVCRCTQGHLVGLEFT